MHFVKGVIGRLGISAEFLQFFWRAEILVAHPHAVAALLLVGFLIIFAQSSAIAPFIYTLF